MDLLENSTFRLHLVAYLRRVLGIQYVNVERVEVDTSRTVPDGAAYMFGETFRFYVKVLPNNTYVFSPEKA